MDMFLFFFLLFFSKDKYYNYYRPAGYMHAYYNVSLSSIVVSLLDCYFCQLLVTGMLVGFQTQLQPQGGILMLQLLYLLL